MLKEFSVLIRSAPEDGFRVICPEKQGVNGQGINVEEVRLNLGEAIKFRTTDP